MSRNIPVSRWRAMAEAVSCWPVTAECRVASRASQCEISDLYSGKFYVILPCVFLQSYYHPNTRSLWCSIYDIHQLLHVSAPRCHKGLSRSAFVGWYVGYTTALGRAFHLVLRFTPTSAIFIHSSTIHATWSWQLTTSINNTFKQFSQ
jgi:hypothetical protein